MSRRPNNLTQDEIASLVATLSDGRPWQEISETFGISMSAVYYHADKNGLLPPKRDTWQSLRPKPWMREALCAQIDPEMFFPEKGGSTRDAIAVCRSCPVAAECLDYALANHEGFGVWGGLPERARRRLTSA